MNFRRSKLAVLALVPALGILTCAAQTVSDYHNRADQALQSFLLKFWDGGRHNLRNRYPSDGSYTGYWTFAQGWDALMDGIERTGGRQYAGLIESFYAGQNQRGWYSGWYDDECWMILALTRAYDLTGDAKFLAQAQAIYDDVMTGWDTGCCGAKPGGLWWDKAHTQKATGAWSSYSTVSLACDLPAGHSTVSVLFDSSRNSANWLNLDNLTITGDPPEELRITRFTPSADGKLHLSWNSRIDETYQVQANPALAGGTWTNLGPLIIANTTNATADFRPATGPATYYRVAAQP